MKIGKGPGQTAGKRERQKARDGCPCQRRAFSLPEVMVAMTLLLFTLAGVLASHLFGLRMMETTGAKISASAEARRNISTLISEVCSAKNAVVGQGNQTSFSEAGIDTPQKGAALQISPSTDTNVFVRYYVDTTARTLNRTTNGAGTAVVLASGIINSDVFTAEDWAGSILTNSQHNDVIGLNLQFNQVEDASLPVGSNRFYTSYHVRTKIARRVF